jgi:hypothetical protein
MCRICDDILVALQFNGRETKMNLPRNVTVILALIIPLGLIAIGVGALRESRAFHGPGVEHVSGIVAGMRDAGKHFDNVDVSYHFTDQSGTVRYAITRIPDRANFDWNGIYKGSAIPIEYLAASPDTCQIESTALDAYHRRQARNLILFGGAFLAFVAFCCWPSRRSWE